MPEIMFTGDIAELLGCTRQNVQYVVKRPDFPAPFGTSPKGTRVWLAADVRKWAAQRH